MDRVSRVKSKHEVANSKMQNPLEECHMMRNERLDPSENASMRPCSSAPFLLLLQGTSSNVASKGSCFPAALTSQGRKDSCCRDLLPHSSWWRDGIKHSGQRKWRVSQGHGKERLCGTQRCGFSLISQLLRSLLDDRECQGL